jgi:hypothetical protein
MYNLLSVRDNCAFYLELILTLVRLRAEGIYGEDHVLTIAFMGYTH